MFKFLVESVSPSVATVFLMAACQNVAVEHNIHKLCSEEAHSTEFLCSEFTHKTIKVYTRVNDTCFKMSAKSKIARGNAITKWLPLNKSFLVFTMLVWLVLIYTETFY